jgi:transcriptional regulator GlxA family with amidase domain
VLNPRRKSSVQQIAKRHNLSHDTVRRIFLAEPGVIIYSGQNPNKRIYRTLRVPAEVEQRVFSRLTNRSRRAQNNQLV